MLTSSQEIEDDDELQKTEVEESRSEQMEQLIEAVQSIDVKPEVNVRVEVPPQAAPAVTVTSAPATVNIPPTPFLKGIICDATKFDKSGRVIQWTMKPIT
jgi:hypothetical protein